MRSRAYTRGIGANTFSPPATTSTTCPPGYHWEDTANAIRGLGDCVPDKVAVLRMPPRIDPGYSLPAASPSVTMTTSPAPPQAPPAGDAAAAPAVVAPPVASCPEPWPWWWLLIAGGLGAIGGTYAAKEQKKKKRRS